MALNTHNAPHNSEQIWEILVNFLLQTQGGASAGSLARKKKRKKSKKGLGRKTGKNIIKNILKTNWKYYYSCILYVTKLEKNIMCHST